MLHSTKAIVLRTVKYGETSLVATLYTELFGVQAYLINGVRTDKKSSTKANLFQPGTLLDTIVYHHPSKNLQRIKEVRLATIYQSIHRQIIKNAIAIYVVELISKTITEPECNPELYHFFEQALLTIDASPEASIANFPLQFTLELASQLGFAIQPQSHPSQTLFDLIQGRFESELSHTSMMILPQEKSQLLARFLHEQNTTHQADRQILLECLLLYLKHHIPHMGELKSPAVLHAVLM